MVKIPTTCKNCKRRFACYPDFQNTPCNQQGCPKIMGKRNKRFWSPADNHDKKVIVEQKVGGFHQLMVPGVPANKQVYEEVEKPVAIRVYFR